MPTTKPSYTITDTGEISEQLNRAQQRWPDVHDRKELLVRLAAAGRDAIERDANERGTAIRETAGALTGVYRPDELERLARSLAGVIVLDASVDPRIPPSAQAASPTLRSPCNSWA